MRKALPMDEYIEITRSNGPILEVLCLENDEPVWVSHGSSLIGDVYEPVFRPVSKDQDESPSPSNLVNHARRELERLDELSEDGSYGGLLGGAVMEIVELFAAQGHSGMSAEGTISYLTSLLRFKPLSDLTDDPEEWNQPDLTSSLQSKRWSAAFSPDGGKSYNLVDDDERELRMTQPAGDPPRRVRSGPLVKRPGQV